MNFLPSIFTASGQVRELSHVQSAQSSTLWTEFTAHLSHFSESSLEETQLLIQKLLENNPSRLEKAVLLTGLARCCIHSGKLIEGPQVLGQAYGLTTVHELSERSFILLEMIGFLAITAQYDLALVLYHQFESMVSSDYLKRVGQYYRLVIESRRNGANLAGELTESLSYFLDIGETALAAYHLKNIGNINRWRKKYSDADAAYSRAAELTEAPEFTHIANAVRHDQAMLRHFTGSSESAVQMLKDLSEIAESPYTRSYALGNIGFILKSRNVWDTAAEYLTSAFQLVNTNQLYFAVPSYGLHLGECHLKLGEPDKALSYFRTGADAARILMANNYPYKGDRKRVIEIYLDALQNRLPSKTNRRFELLQFAVDKPMEEIRKVFQSAVLEAYSRKYPLVSKMAASLGMARRTYYIVQKRTIDVSAEPARPYISEFLAHHGELPWKTLNRTFESELFPFLLKSYGGSKKRLSEKLKMNYVALVNLTNRHDLRKTDSISQPKEKS